MPRSHWSTPSGAQTGGSTIPFPIGWRRRPPSAPDSCRPLIEAGPAAGSGGGGGSGLVAILDRGSGRGGGRRPQWDSLNCLASPCSGPHACWETPQTSPTRAPTSEWRRTAAPGSAATQQGRPGARRPPARRGRGFLFPFCFETITWVGGPAFAERLGRLRRVRGALRRDSSSSAGTQPRSRGAPSPLRAGGRAVCGTQDLP